MTRLATFVHVSDLHFGDADPDTGDSLIGTPPPWWDSCHLFNGFLGHHRDALVQFQEIFDNLRDTEKALLLATGDLTAFAHDDAADDTRNQFQIAKSYISSYWQIGQLDPLGLNLGPTTDSKLDHTVPGNHDHWGGNGTPLKALVNGGPVDAFGQIFRKSPFIEKYSLSTGLPDVVFIGIDTDAGVNQADLVFAKGILTNQIATVRGKIQPRANPPGEIRVLLMHHSPMYSDPDGMGVLSLDCASKAALAYFVDDYQVSVMLTGHIHVPNAKVTVTAKSRRDVLEARCGTTTARDHVPPGWSWRGAAPGDQLPPNTFLVHQLLGTQDAAGKTNSIRWQTTLYARTVAGFASQGLLPGADIQVWP